ncbi:MAG: SpoIIIAH-like family protein [Syntrophomonadaceae bacterium]|nr:SpoIIIAH-like family protein [Syntrophomonadaceae bacterium]
MITLVFQRRKLWLGLGALAILVLLIYYCWHYIGSVKATLAEANPLLVPVEESRISNSAESLSALENQAISEMENELIPVTAVGAQAKENSRQFFAEFRMERDRIRSQQVELYREIINNPDSTTEIRQEAQQKLLNLTQEIDKEMKIENLLTARGYSEAVVFLQPQAVSVVVLSPGFTAEQKQSVIKLVSSVLGYKENMVSVITRE